MHRYLSKPQQWNRYAYVINSPHKYIDPTGEKIWIPGSVEHQAAALARIQKVLGEDLSKYLTLKCVDTHIGRVLEVSYDPHANGDAIGRFGDRTAIRFSQILESNRVIEYRLSEVFTTKEGRFLTRDYGGAATITASESTTGNTQIFVHPDAAFIVKSQMEKDGWIKSNDGKPLAFSDDIVDAHEYGHAAADMVYNSPSRSFSERGNQYCGKTTCESD